MCRVCEENAAAANAVDEPRSLADYATHLAYCEWYEGNSCTCGLDEVLHRAIRSGNAGS